MGAFPPHSLQNPGPRRCPGRRAPAKPPLPAAPASMKPVRRRMALRCSRRSRLSEVLGDIPAMLTPVAHARASCAQHRVRVQQNPRQHPAMLTPVAHARLLRAYAPATLGQRVQQNPRHSPPCSPPSRTAAPPVRARTRNALCVTHCRPRALPWQHPAATKQTMQAHLTRRAHPPGTYVGQSQPSMAGNASERHQKCGARSPHHSPCLHVIVQCSIMCRKPWHVCCR